MAAAKKSPPAENRRAGSLCKRWVGLVGDSLQLGAKHRIATPANWKEGEDVVISPAVSNEDAEKMFPKGFKEVKSYLRMTPQPNRN